VSCDTPAAAANQVLIIGDSFFAAGHRVTAFLEDAARQSGALVPGERYRDASSLLDNTLALLGSGIEQQYLAASAESPVSVVIMNGGGADLLLGSCEVLASDCTLLADAATAARTLFVRLNADGVEHVIYALYPNPVDAELRAEVDALRPMIQTECAASPVPCHWIDLRPVFEGRYATYIEADGNNPTPEGARATASAIWTTMQRACIAH
jgi:hypothetical protein